ncbi:MAG: bifunctional (p)ppGpp synthetase/guanosine-3',5'-bis(diphosphate) 3'-pyrophosphohydrolase [Erysipelotrichaceae bacterium]|nr:bifunctional (p)ppGpp synthetase/guanosine-3',5'-bis(diphosphate) 3'-pyrophosphohydrolase [Erysipelotrichaceae bacterium]
MSSHVVVTDELFFNEVRKYITDEQSLDMIRRAHQFAREKHEGQFRKSGDPYFSHALNVGYILATIQAGPQTICAGLLHDVMEDCGVSYEQIAELFDPDVANLVEGVTKIGNIQFKDEKEYLAANHRKIFIAMAKDIRVILIKLVDRLHNMRTLSFHTPEKQKKIASETLQVYAPIAHRLGLAEIKNELEDLSFLYLQPEKYREIASLVEAKKAERQAIVDRMIEEIREMLQKHNFHFRIFGRCKHLYSIYNKMVTKNKRFDEILDLYAIRIVTETELNCYEILGYIHAQYRPVNGRLKDYIAMPKMNMYQSLHTTILDENGYIFEVQIRTEEMDDVAERGVAAHWSYKEGKYNSASEQKEIENKLGWFHDMITMMDEAQLEHPTDFMNQIQKDIFEANVYVMTPKGRVIELPNGSTPIDFAYRVHTDVGHSMVGAIVNGAMVPISTKLKTGDVVNIKTAKGTGPSEDWLKIAKTATARSKIKAYLQKKENEDRAEMIAKGEKMLAEEVRKRGLDEKEFLDKNHYEGLYGQLGVNNYNELMYAIATKSANPAHVIDKTSNVKRPSLIDNNTLVSLFSEREKKKKRIVSEGGVVVEGIDNVKVAIAGCCMPVYGDPIVGYITKGFGVKVHRADCPNIVNESSRLIDVKWDESQDEHTYECWIRIDATDRNFLISDIVTLLSQYKITITGLNSEVLPDKINSYVEIRMKVKDNVQLQNVIDNMRKIDSIVSVSRIMK